MLGSRNYKRSEWLLRAAVFVLNATAITLLVLKLVFGRITNDDLIAIMLVVFLANIAIAWVRRRTRTQIDE